MTGGLTHSSLPQLPALIPPGKLSNTPRVSLGGSSSTFALKITKAIAVTNNSASTSKARYVSVAIVTYVATRLASYINKCESVKFLCLTQCLCNSYITRRPIEHSARGRVQIY